MALHHGSRDDSGNDSGVPDRMRQRGNPEKADAHDDGTACKCGIIYKYI